jgi:hypothetical protein
MAVQMTFVRHKLQGYVGVRDGTTKLQRLFESKFDREGCRVKLADGKIMVASACNLEELAGKDHTVETHKRKLEGRGLAYAGVQEPEPAAAREEGRCKGCGSDLSSTWGLVCGACGGVVCDCGACPCSQKAKKRPAKPAVARS